ncbi:MAG: hypothetical protein ACI845_002634 [Gammaproteobacteria bacterium]|jgi:hypothetical protein
MIESIFETVSRRIFMKTVLVGSFGFTSNSGAAEKPKMIISYLINTLRSVNNPVCEKVASNLLLFKSNKSHYDLHLRNADLNNNEVKLIAEATKIVNDEGGPLLRSFSMSYNSNLRDEGVLMLVKSLPSTVTEIGLVQCGLGDKGGEALMIWASNVPTLHWLCVEQNSFSDKTRGRLVKLGKERNG